MESKLQILCLFIAIAAMDIEGPETVIGVFLLFMMVMAVEMRWNGWSHVFITWWLQSSKR